MSDPFAAAEDDQLARSQGSTATKILGSSTSAKLSKLRGKLFTKHSQPSSSGDDSEDAATSAAQDLSASLRSRPGQGDDINDFLHGGPPIPPPAAAPRRNLSLLAPRLNLAAAKEAQSVSPSIEERWKPTKPRRREGLGVSFDITHIAVIGYGGDEAQQPVTEVQHRLDTIAGDSNFKSTPLKRVQTGFSDTAISASSEQRDYSAIRPSTGYRQNKHVPSSDPPPPPDTTSSGGQIREARNDAVHGLRRMRAAEGLAFRAAAAPVLDGSASIHPSTADSSDPDWRPSDARTLPNEISRGTGTSAVRVITHEDAYIAPPLHQRQPRPVVANEGKASLLEPTLPDLESPSSGVSHPVAPPDRLLPDRSRRRRPVPVVQPTDNRSNGDTPGLTSFGSHVRHLTSIFALASSLHKSPTPAEWARAATWWFLRGRGGLEDLVRSSTSHESHSAPIPLVVHHLNLAKVWWIIVEVIPSLADAMLTPTVVMTLHSLTTSFEALLHSMGKRKLLPSHSLEVMSGLDTSVWTPRPPLHSALEAELLKSFSPVSRVMPALDDGTNAFIDLPISNTSHCVVYLRAFARALLIPHSGTRNGQNFFPVLITFIRASDLSEDALIVTTQSESIDLAATLVSNVHAVHPISRGSPAFQPALASTDARTSSISIPLACPTVPSGEDAALHVEILLRPVDFNKLFGPVIS